MHMQERSCKDIHAQNGNDYAMLDDMGKRKNRAAVSLGRMGGKKGGHARWEGVSAKDRSRILRAAAVARWKKEKP
jgi:hypothetical protein